MAWEENSRICLHMQLIAILSRIGVKAVRNMMLQRGIVPEDLPAGEDVKKVERRLKSDEKTLTKKNCKKK